MSEDNQKWEFEAYVASGWPALWMFIASVIGLLVMGGMAIKQEHWTMGVSIAIATFIVLSINLTGCFTLEPNEAGVLKFFGKYKGSVGENGYHWVSPFYSLEKISIKAQNFVCDTLKVNDKKGNPIEIAAVIVWRVQDTAKALFGVENYANYVKTQSEAALRFLASQYAYDHGTEITLREGGVAVNAVLKECLDERLIKAGVIVDEARIAHLAYAPEIAQVMLRRQQAEAVIEARQKIVQGAVLMVEQAFKELRDKNLPLDGTIGNLLVVLCSESGVHPVVNVGRKHA